MITLLKSQLLTEAGFGAHGFTMRHKGSSEAPFDSLNLAYDVGDKDEHTAANLRALRSSLSVDAPLLRLRQVHGDVVLGHEQIAATADTDWSNVPTTEGDGVILPAGTHVYGAVQTADCAAVLLADPANRHVAVIHAGWRGTHKGVLRNAIRGLTELGAKPIELLAAIGPTICQKCYEVGEDVAKLFPESVDPIKKSPGKFLLDLPYAVEVSLIAGGLTSANIERLGACTRCRPDDFFSHRGTGPATGRMLGFISPL